MDPKWKILLMVADPAIVHGVRQYFRLHWPEAEVTAARAGAKGIVLLKKQPPDLVVLDIALPDMNGLAVCQEIHRLSDLPVIILAQKGDEAEMVQSYAVGADDYIRKPISNPVLKARIQAVLRRTYHMPGTP